MPQKGNGPRLLLALKEKPSFQGELRIDLVEENDSEGCRSIHWSAKRDRHLTR
jgi:hypothetical protein